ncbi:MAG: acetyl-CoA decarbonylase/synthase complex subunit gamma [Candidatus Omnitrophota bacterium]
MSLSGLDIYKLLPKTNCRECGFVTCLAYAMQLAKKAVALDKCPYLSEASRKMLEESSLPPIKLITVGAAENKLEIGNETVLFRHEEKFHHPCGIGFLIEDSLTDAGIKERLEKIKHLHFERIGEELKPDLIALKQKSSSQRFLQALKLVLENTSFPLMLMSEEPFVLREALAIAEKRRPLIYRATDENKKEIAALAKEFSCPLVASAHDLEHLSCLVMDLNKVGVSELVLEIQEKPLGDKIWDFTQLRRQALKKANRKFGYPVLSITACDGAYEEIMEAVTYMTKYAGIVILKGIEPAGVLSLLTLRQNIYTDPQKPLQIEPKLYAIGHAFDKSPVLVTTNFSLTYYTVAGEVEASKIPSYILCVDTEGMSVLTAWAAEKFNAGKISDSLKKFAVEGTVGHRRLVIPGYVAVISGELEDQSGWQVVVGPKEATGLPSFLKNL